MRIEKKCHIAQYTASAKDTALCATVTHRPIFGLHAQ